MPMHVRVNAATSVDGKLSTRERTQVAISGPEDFARVDSLRAEHDAVMVGVGTVLADDPSLTVDDAPRSAQPARVVADSTLRTPLDACVLDDAADTYVLASDAADPDDVRAVEAAGARVIVAGADRVDLRRAFEALEDQGIDRLMVEGGGELVFSLFDAGLVDELSVYIGSRIIGGRSAPTLADGEGFFGDFPSLSLSTVDRIDDGVLLEYDV
jgi:2,5-diamino-6-(ribosylamino)-4(3H)-pyrimidinone 5'-phosphate reductase